jgi:hypothetical protein
MNVNACQITTAPIVAFPLKLAKTGNALATMVPHVFETIIEMLLPTSTSIIAIVQRQMVNHPMLACSAANKRLATAWLDERKVNMPFAPTVESVFE